MNKIILVCVFIAVPAFADPCDEYENIVKGITTEEASITARCPENGNLIDVECRFYNGSGYGEPERASFRSSKCNYIADYDSAQYDEDGVAIEGTEKYNYDVKIVGLCCK